MEAPTNAVILAVIHAEAEEGEEDITDDADIVNTETAAAILAVMISMMKTMIAAVIHAVTPVVTPVPSDLEAVLEVALDLVAAVAG